MPPPQDLNVLGPVALLADAKEARVPGDGGASENAADTNE